MKFLSFLTASWLIIALNSTAQDKIAQKYAATITKEDAFKRLSKLTSDDFTGRGTGQPGAEKAAQYIKSQFELFGLTAPVNKGYFQQLDLKEIMPKERNITVNGKSQLFLKDFFALPYFAKAIHTSYSDFVFVGYGIEDKNYNDLADLDLNGKVAVVLEGEPVINGNSLITGTTTLSNWSIQKNKKLAALSKKNPSAIIFLDSQVRLTKQPQISQRNSLVLGNPKEIATPLIIYGSEDFVNDLLTPTGKSIKELSKRNGETQKPDTFEFNANLDIDFTVNSTPLNAKNVLGFLEGTDPVLKNELVVVTAHYDHLGINDKGEIFNGADDDGSGTTAVLELAEAFAKAKKEGYGSKRSILFMTVVGEEKGLLGSEWYSEHPVFPLENTIVNLNIDMIGRVGELYKNKADSANYVYVIGSDKLSTTLRKISESTNKTYSNLTLDYKYDDPKDPMRIYYRSDHYNFAKHGIPIIFYFNGLHEDYHKKTDDIEKINFPLLVKRAKLVFYTAWELANNAHKPVVDKMDNAEN